MQTMLSVILAHSKMEVIFYLEGYIQNDFVRYGVRLININHE